MSSCRPRDCGARSHYLLKKMQSIGFQADLLTYNLFMETALKFDRFELADEVFDRMRRQGVWPNLQSLTARINRFAKSGRPPATGPIYHRKWKKPCGSISLAEPLMSKRLGVRSSVAGATMIAVG